jgi:hypothetical protein
MNFYLARTGERNTSNAAVVTASMSVRDGDERH